MSVGAAGIAPGPPGFVIVAVLSINVPTGVPPAITEDTVMTAVPLAGTAALETVSVCPAIVQVAPEGQPPGTTDKLVNAAGKVSVTETPEAVPPAVSCSVIVY